MTALWLGLILAGIVTWGRLVLLPTDAERVDVHGLERIARCLMEDL